MLKFGGPANNSYYGNLEKSDGRFWDPNVCLKTILLGRWLGVSLLLSMHETPENRRQTDRQTDTRKPRFGGPKRRRKNLDLASHTVSAWLPDSLDNHTQMPLINGEINQRRATSMTLNNVCHIILLCRRSLLVQMPHSQESCVWSCQFLGNLFLQGENRWLHLPKRLHLPKMRTVHNVSKKTCLQRNECYFWPPGLRVHFSTFWHKVSLLFGRSKWAVSIRPPLSTYLCT